MDTNQFTVVVTQTLLVVKASYEQVDWERSGNIP